ncbi:MAG: c-type cytochrome [Mesorhizobium sp.]|nr:MAG: c-type cytochrome [Mesorhizobium sp.]
MASARCASTTLSNGNVRATWTSNGPESIRRLSLSVASWLRAQREVADYLIAHGVILPTPAPISKKLAAADVEKGRSSFSRLCAYCHNAVPDEGANQGPTLWNVVGRDKASVAKRRYSDALLAWQGVLTYEDLNKFLLEPMLTTPGVYMEVPGVPDETERTNLIAYLRTLSDTPIPLP